MNKNELQAGLPRDPVCEPDWADLSWHHHPWKFCHRFSSWPDVKLNFYCISCKFGCLLTVQPFGASSLAFHDNKALASLVKARKKTRREWKNDFQHEIRWCFCFYTLAGLKLTAILGRKVAKTTLKRIKLQLLFTLKVPSSTDHAAHTKSSARDSLYTLEHSLYAVALEDSPESLCLPNLSVRHSGPIWQCEKHCKMRPSFLPRRSSPCAPWPFCGGLWYLCWLLLLLPLSDFTAESAFASPPAVSVTKT